MLFSNWHLKLLALLIAFLLWAAYTSEPSAEVGFQVPIEFRHVPARLELAGQVPTDVYVRVRGHSAVLRRMTARDLAIVIDLAGSAPGEALIRLTPEGVDAPAGVEVVRIAPAQIRLQLTERLSP